MAESRHAICTLYIAMKVMVWVSTPDTPSIAFIFSMNSASGANTAVSHGPKDAAGRAMDTCGCGARARSAAK